MRRSGILAALAVVLAETASAETITVCAEGCDYVSINAAIAAASDGDIIQLAAETYQEGVEIDTLGKAITLRGTVDKNGDPTSVLDGQSSIQVLVTRTGESSATRFENMVIRNGYADRGGGMANLGTSPTVVNCRFESNFAVDHGGAVFLSGGLPTLQGCFFADNSASDLGGAIYVRMGRPAIMHASFYNNCAARGGAIASWGLPYYPEDYAIGCNLTVTGCQFMENTGLSNQGGAMMLFQSSGSIHDCNFVDNSCIVYGGGAIRIIGVMDAARQTPSQWLVSSCVFYNNTAQFGGAIGITHSEGEVNITGSTFGENLAANLGGAVGVLGSGLCSISKCQFDTNNAVVGSAVYLHDRDSVLTLLTDCAFTSCCEVTPPWSFTDGGGNDYQAWCDDCRADVNCLDDAVDAADLAYMLGVWGTSDPQCDITGDGIVDGADLGALLISWGPCP